MAFIQLPLPIYERELTPQERNVHAAYWGKLTELVPDKYFSPDSPIFNFMEVGLGLPTLSGQIKSSGHSVGLIDLMAFSGPSPDYNRIQEVLDEAGESRVFMLSPMTCGYDIFKTVVTAIKLTYPRSTTIAGGAHVSKLPMETLFDIPDLDIAVSDQRFTVQDLVGALLAGDTLDGVDGLGACRNTGPREARRTRLPRSVARCVAAGCRITVTVCA